MPAPQLDQLTHSTWWSSLGEFLVTAAVVTFGITATALLFVGVVRLALGLLEDRPAPPAGSTETTEPRQREGAHSS